MKKLLNLFLILLLLVSIPQVYAEGEDEENTEGQEWGQKYTKGQFEYTIDGFVLNVYELEATSTEGLSEEQAAQAQEESKQKMMKYVSGEPTRVISLSPSDITPNIKYQVDKFDDVDTLFIDLNHNLTKEKLETLLQQEIASTTKEKQYIVDLCVKYTLTKIPEKYQFFYNYDVTRQLLGSVLSGGGSVPKLDMTKSNQQVLNRITIQVPEAETEETVEEKDAVKPEEVEAPVEEEKEKENTNPLFGFEPETFELIPPVKEGNADTPVLTYERKIDGSNMANFINLIMLSTKDYIGTENTTGDQVTEDDLYYIMFHEAENIEVLIDQLKASNPSTAVDTKEEIKVGDTSKMMSGYVYVGSTILILAGLGIVLHIVKQKQKENGKRI